MERANRLGKRGFTLTEVMLTVAILVTLFALVSVPVAKYRKSVRQSELDSKAELVFTAVQNRLIQLQSAGTGSLYSAAHDDVKSLGLTPWGNTDDRIDDLTLYYFTSNTKNTEGCAAYAAFPKEQADIELWGNEWVVEYDPESGSVYAVFYGEDGEMASRYTPESFNLLRNRENRLEDGARVGYYSGDTVAVFNTSKLEPSIEVINTDHLQVKVTCDPKGQKSLKYRVRVAELDENGKETGTPTEFDLSTANGDSIKWEAPNYVATMTFDSLDNGMRFSEQRRFNGITPGKNIKVTVTVSCDDPLIDATSRTIITNSLFADLKNGDTAVIRYGRHLQNLDSASKVSADVKNAVQEKNIDFKSDAEDEWYSLYGDRKFTSITNDNLVLLENQNNSTSGGQVLYSTIYDLSVEGGNNSGLFSSIQAGNKLTLKNIRLSGANIAGGNNSNAGGLVGSVAGELEVTGCQVFLTGNRGHLSDKDKQWINGKNSGGIVGKIENTGNVSVKNSFASTTVNGSATVGGLVGSSEGGLNIEHSYADCYLKSNGSSGGLLGYGSDISTLRIKDAYAVGFILSGTSYGIAGKTLKAGDSVENAYTACAPLDEAVGSLNYSTVAGNNVGSVNNVYYLCSSENQIGELKNWKSSDRQNAANILGSAFAGDDSSGLITVAYNLKVSGLMSYTYPKLTGLNHYGDWQAEFESGAVAYYEVYKDGKGNISYGFFGGNKSELKDDKTIVGDGYGIVFEGAKPVNTEVTIDGNKITLEASTEIEIPSSQTSDNKTYWVLPFPKDVVNPGRAVDGFYKHAEINGLTYSFNPHFAKIVYEGRAVVDKQSDQEISIRTARQLNNLSAYYGGYRNMISSNAVFTQEQDIDYDDYLWSEYTNKSGKVLSQKPIGDSSTLSFIHTYEGAYHEITGFSIDSTSNYVGLFGYSSGRLRNIVYTVDVAVGNSNPFVIRKYLSLSNAYIGMLVGLNEGSVYNCAASGFQLRVQAYSSSTAFIGGLVGRNYGRINYCSADFPIIYGTSTYSRMYVGGMTGSNSGQIYYSYAVGSINIEDIKGGGVYIAGFAAENSSSIRDSYCAVGLVSAGAETSRFSSANGSISNSYYLDGGTYLFREAMTLYDDTADSIQGTTRLTDEKLASQKISGFGSVTEAYTFNHAGTVGTNYPYPGCVRDENGNIVHYGDWPIKANIGKFGVFYWEKEDGGANSGYHFSYIGYDQVSTNSALTRISGSTLCEVHDDGGVITEYGYGYFWKDDTSEPTLRILVDNNSVTAEGHREDIDSIMKTQVTGYNFMSFESGENGLKLNSSNAHEAVWTLTRGTISRSFVISPFFGNSLSYDSDDNPGSGAHPYEIRSISQLQYINWSYNNGSGSTSAYVTSSNYNTFPYLQYATVTSTGKQDRRNAEQNRPQQCWIQSHDLNGASRKANEASSSAFNTSFSPIAGAVSHGNNANDYSLILYAWFGGNYDGQSYYINNINIDTPVYNVGLFGTTVGANIKNIVLYSDNGATITRTTLPTPSSNSTNDVREYRCSYAIGGLVGISYVYSGDSSTSSTVSNCAIAGYVINDNSKNAIRVGEVAIGGLIGVSNINLKQCSAVVDINVNCTHIEKGTTSKLNSAKWGNFIRVGGLVGGLRDNATDCYTGGKINIGEGILKERVLADSYDNTALTMGETATEIKSAADGSKPGTYVFIGGIGASGFSANFSNFTGSGSTPSDGAPNFVNCYTYIEFPEIKGTICAISLIGSAADRARYTTVSATNCYYLSSSKDSIKIDKATKAYHSGMKSLYDVLHDRYNGSKYVEDMLNGDLRFLSYYLWSMWNNNQNNKTLSVTEKTYEEMTQNSFKNALGKSYDWVSATEKTETGEDAAIHGKYSYPGDVSALLGQNYPFPTVLRQDKNGQTMNLHYGRWPVYGIYWPKGLDSMDLIADYDPTESVSSVELELKPAQITIPDDAKIEFCYSDEDSANQESDVAEAEVIGRGDKGSFRVKIIGKAVGATPIIAKVTIGGSTYTARFVMNVTAELSIRTIPDEEISVYEQESGKMILQALDKNGDPLPNETWTAISSDPNIFSALIENDGLNGGIVANITGNGAGEASMTIRVSCTLSSGVFVASTVRTVDVYEHSILGVGNTSGGSPYYSHGLLTKDSDSGNFKWFEAASERTFEANAPGSAESKLFVYSKGEDAPLDQYEVKNILILPKGGKIAEIYPDGGDDYLVEIGTVKRIGDYDLLPIKVYGKKEESVTIKVTLTDKRSKTDFDISASDYSIKAPYLRTVTYEYVISSVAATRTEVYKGDQTITLIDYSTLPEPDKAARFKCWKLRNADGSLDPNEYKTDSFELSSDVTFVAVYEDTEN